ncbi:MAG: hypothetical protein E7262_01020 [Lachnospiraceae bacterium]|nr:hypothetical protein [Lachnospiraceae bacterium]
MKKNMLAVFIMALVIANLVISSITLMVITPSLKNTNEFVTKVAAAIELEELEKKQEVSLEDMETYTLKKSSESVIINLKNYEDGNSYVVIKGISLTLNTQAADYGKVKKLIDKNIDMVTDEIDTIYAKYSKDEAKERKSKIKTEILDSLAEMFETETIVDISFGSITYQ